MEKPTLYLALLLIGLSCWVWLAFRPAETINATNRAASSLPFRSSTALATYIGNKTAGPTRLSAIKTLVYGSPARQSGRVWTVAMNFLLLPLFGLAYMWIFIDSAVWGEFLLLIQFFVIISVPINVAKWVATLRALWLRVPGDRVQFWYMWKDFLRTELLLSILMLGLYGLAVQLIFDISDVSAALYAVVALLLLPSLSYTAAWFQLRGAFSNSLALWSGVVYLSTIIVLVIATYAMDAYLPVAWLAFLTISIGSLAYFQVRNGFSNLDWLQVRPGPGSLPLV